MIDNLTQNTLRKTLVHGENTLQVYLQMQILPAVVQPTDSGSAALTACWQIEDGGLVIRWQVRIEAGNQVDSTR